MTNDCHFNHQQTNKAQTNYQHSDFLYFFFLLVFWIAPQIGCTFFLPIKKTEWKWASIFFFFDCFLYAWWTFRFSLSFPPNIYSFIYVNECNVFFLFENKRTPEWQNNQQPKKKDTSHCFGLYLTTKKNQWTVKKDWQKKKKFQE